MARQPKSCFDGALATCVHVAGWIFDSSHEINGIFMTRADHCRNRIVRRTLCGMFLAIAVLHWHGAERRRLHRPRRRLRRRRIVSGGVRGGVFGVCDDRVVADSARLANGVSPPSAEAAQVQTRRRSGARWPRFRADAKNARRRKVAAFGGSFKRKAVSCRWEARCRRFRRSRGRRFKPARIPASTTSSTS